MNWIMLIIAGFLSGITASMGLGGGFVLLLYLTFFTSLPQREAQLVNLLFFLPIACLSCYLHRKHQLIETKVLRKTLWFAIPGVFLGAWLTSFLNTDWLMKLFGGLVLFVGCKEVFFARASKDKN